MIAKGTKVCASTMSLKLFLKRVPESWVEVKEREVILVMAVSFLVKNLKDDTCVKSRHLWKNLCKKQNSKDNNDKIMITIIHLFSAYPMALGTLQWRPVSIIIGCMCIYISYKTLEWMHNNKKITILIVFTWRFKHVHTNTLQCLRNLEVECDMAWPPGEKERLTKALRVQFSTHRTDASLSGLTLLQPAVQFFLKVDNIQACGRGAGHLLHPQLTVFCPFSVS